MALDYGVAVSQKGYDVKTCDDRFLVYSSAFQTLKIFSVTSLSIVLPNGSSADFTANAGTDVITSNGHGLSNGNQVNFTTDGALPGGLLEYTEEVYFVINAAINTFQVSLTPGGSAVDITSTGSGIHSWWNDMAKAVIEHNIGFYSPYLIIYNGSSRRGVTNSFLDSDGYGQQYALTTRNRINRLDVVLPNYFDDDATQPGDTVYFTVYMFLDDFGTIAARSINSGTSSGASSTDYGIRISKAGFDVKTCDDKDCVLSSSFFNNIVHKRGIEYGNTGDIVITHSLGYVPSALIWLRDEANSYMSSASFSIDATDLQLFASGEVNYYCYYLIFKNKLNG